MPEAGLTTVADRIRKQVKSRLDGHLSSGDAFVVSVYGEWGIGKTRCLKDIFAGFERELQQQLTTTTRDASSPLVVPVLFDPWQYEHEEHLVIPLLKTIEHKLGAVEEALPRDLPREVGQSLKSAALVLGDTAVALLSGFKFKFAPLKEFTGIDVELTPKEVFETNRAATERRKKPQATTKSKQRLDDLARRESLYFDVRAALGSLTNDSAPRLRLVVLIDDLDRCLPEKAIQVLESVKLFLNVAGFSFVIAVDDEVVERGISHRYRDYARADRAGAMASTPISGAEYLEKIVHLPVHLQRWTADEASAFLRSAYPRLFLRAKDEAGADEKRPRDAGTAQEGKRAPSPSSGSPDGIRADELVTLAITSVPLVPRKLIRLAEALEFFHDQFLEAGAQPYWQPLHAARLVALQQLYPSLYRLIRLRPARYWRLFELVRNEFGEPSVVNGKPLHVLRKEFGERARPEVAEPETAGAASTSTIGQRRAETDTLREQLTLLEVVDEVGRQRGSPDPLLLFAAATNSPERHPERIGSGLNIDSFARLYINGMAPAPQAAPPLRADDSEQVTPVTDSEMFLSVLTRADTVGRREYLASHNLGGGRLPDAVLDELLTRLSEPSSAVRLTDIGWLKDVSSLMSREQFLSLYQTHDVLARIMTGQGGQA
jgi:hypothetical protein